MCRGRTYSAAGIAGFAVFMLPAIGCAPTRTTFRVPTISFANYQQAEKINLNVELRLSGTLRNATAVRSQGAQIFVMPLGEHFAVNSESVARAAFTEVSVSKDITRPAKAPTEAVLIPKIIFAQRVPPLYSSANPVYKIVVILEWTMTDMSGELVWVDTITAEGKVSDLTGSADEDAKKLMEALVPDLFTKSYEAISSSPEIRNFAAAPTPKGRKS